MLEYGTMIYKVIAIFSTGIHKHGNKFLVLTERGKYCFVYASLGRRDKILINLWKELLPSSLFCPSEVLKKYITKKNLSCHDNNAWLLSFLHRNVYNHLSLKCIALIHVFSLLTYIKVNGNF